MYTPTSVVARLARLTISARYRPPWRPLRQTVTQAEDVSPGGVVWARARPCFDGHLTGFDGGPGGPPGFDGFDGGPAAPDQRR